MRVLIVTDHFLPSLGGVQRHTHTLARYLSDLSHQVSVVTSPTKNPSKDSQFDRDLKGLHRIRVFRKLPRAIPEPINTARYFAYCHNVARYINVHQDNFDIVHYHGMHQLFLKFAKSRIPIITTLHGVFPVCILQRIDPCGTRSAAKCAICELAQKNRYAPFMPLILPYYHLYYKFMEESLNSLTKVVCVSEHLRNYITKVSNISNLVTIHNFIDFQHEIQPELTSSTELDIRNHLRIPHDAKLITYFGRLSFEKGVDVLIAAVKKLLEEFGDRVYSIIGGDGPERRCLENMASSVENIVFTGRLPRKVQLAVLAQSDAFLHPARYPDACPTVILEAMALGVPIVATKTGGVPELIAHGKNGYLARPNSSSDFAAKISNLISNTSFQFRARASNLKLSRKFDISHIGPQITKLYENALNTVRIR